MIADEGTERGDACPHSLPTDEDGDLLLAKVTPCFENGKKAVAIGLPTGIGFATSEVHVVRLRRRTKPKTPRVLGFCPGSDKIPKLGFVRFGSSVHTRDKIPKP